MQRLFSTIGEVLAPTFHSSLDDIKNHWKAIKTFYIEKNDDIESFHEFQLPGHIISMVSILIEENKSFGDAGPCLEFFLKNRILETLCLLGVHDTPTGVRKLVLQTITILLSDLSLPLLPHMSVHRPICKLIKSIININTKQQQLHKSSDNSLSPSQLQQQEIARLVPHSNRSPNQSNDESEFVSLLETLACKLKLYPTLLGFFQDDSFAQGENFIVFQGLLKHLWTMGSVGERARKAMVQCLELMPETNAGGPLIDDINRNLNHQFNQQLDDKSPSSSSTILDSSSSSPINNNNNNNNINSSGNNIVTSPIKTPLIPLTTPPQSPMKRSVFDTPAKDLPIDDKMDFVHPDPLFLLNHVKFINSMISELIKTYHLLPSTIASINYCLSGAPVSSDHMNILECYKARVSFVCSLSTLTHNNIGEYITKLWEESFIADTLGPSLLHIEDYHCATAMLYLREILPLLQGTIAKKTITFLVGERIHLINNNNKSDHEDDTNDDEEEDDEDDDCIIRKTLISRMSHNNYVVSISTLRLFSTLLGLYDFLVVHNLILVHLDAQSSFTYHNYATLQEAQKSITKYLSLFGNRYSSFKSSLESNLSELLENKVSSQTNGYSAYLVDARYQISLYNSTCSTWPPNYLFNNVNNNNNTKILSPINNNNNNNIIKSPSSSTTTTSTKGIGRFLSSLFNLLSRSLTLPIDINFIITGIFSKLCYYPCPQLYPHLIHCPNININQQQTNNNNNKESRIPSLYSMIESLSNDIESRSHTIINFTDALDHLRIHMTDINNVGNKDSKIPESSSIASLEQPDIDFLNAVIVLEEFSKELASIIQARVVFDTSK